MITPSAPSGLPASQDPLSLLAALLAGSAVLSLAFGLRLQLAQWQQGARLRAFVDVSPDATPGRVGQASQRARLAPAVGWLVQRAAGVLPDRAAGRIRADLILAGYAAPRHLTHFLAAKVLLAALSALAPLVLLLNGAIDKSLGPLSTVGGAALGFYLPGVWLKQRIKARRKAISRALPDALDLLAISVGAGLGFDGALNEVVQRWHSALGEELAAVQRDMRLGHSRGEALRALAERTAVPEVRAFVAAVLQADELGTPLRDALRIQSDQMRQQRRQKAEEQARQAVVKMLVPMVLFIFPTIFIVLLGPAVPTVMDSFGGGSR